MITDTIEPAKKLIIDISSLKTIKNYSKTKNVSVQAIYKWIDKKKVKLIEIDGAKFIQPSSSDPK